MLPHAEAPTALLAAGIAFTAHIKGQQLHVCKLHRSLGAAASLHDLVLRGMVCSALIAVTIHQLAILVEYKEPSLQAACILKSTAERGPAGQPAPCCARLTSAASSVQPYARGLPAGRPSPYEGASASCCRSCIHGSYQGAKCGQQVLSGGSASATASVTGQASMCSGASDRGAHFLVASRSSPTPCLKMLCKHSSVSSWAGSRAAGTQPLDPHLDSGRAGKRCQSTTPEPFDVSVYVHVWITVQIGLRKAQAVTKLAGRLWGSCTGTGAKKATSRCYFNSKLLT